MKKIFILIILFVSKSFGQETDITPALKEIESGNIQNALTYLQDFKSVSPNDPSVIFLDGVLTQNGEEAVKKYSVVYDKFPKSKYADAALYRIFSYYYAFGYYKKADGYLDKLKSSYPASPYINVASRTIPEEQPDSPDNDLGEKTKTEVYKYTIQAGSFLNADNAKNLNEKINSDGYPAEIAVKEIAGSNFNIVYVGKFKNEDEAKPVLEFLEKKYSLKGRIIELTNSSQ